MLNKVKLDFLAILFLVILSPLFFYKLGQSSLVSFDEAWYADIARNILKNGNPIEITWNGRFFIDHPPGGFWLMAVSYMIFGVSEFSARFPSAFLGLLTLVFTYLLGRRLFNRVVGFASSIALSSSPWFLFRARSGNLDVPLTFFFVLTIYLAILAENNRKFLLPFALSLSFLFLIKTAVPFTIFPVILFIFLISKKMKVSEVIKPLFIFLLIVGGWFFYRILESPGFLRHYFKIGLPGVGVKPSFADNLKLMKEYLHNGIGKWFWPGTLSVVLEIFTFQRKFLILAIFFLSFFTPFLFSEKGHIWQLIPLHPFLILSFFGFSFVLLEKFGEIILSIIKKPGKKLNSYYKTLKLITIPTICISILTVSFYISYLQWRRNWYEYIDIPAFISDEAILSREAGKYDEKFYIDGDFLPTAIFYSEKNVKQVQNDELRGLFEKEESFTLITYQWRLDRLGIESDEYEIIKTDRDKILIKRINL